MTNPNAEYPFTDDNQDFEKDPQWDARRTERLAPLVAALDAALASEGWAVPEGWVLVPRQPSWEMKIAGRDSLCDTLDDDASTTDSAGAYLAMIAAAPTPPSAQVQP